MFKKLVDLQDQLQADHARLEADVAELQAVIAKPEPPAFDEFAAASRITAAKSKDHLEGGKSADAVTKAIDKERVEAAKKLETFATEKANAQKALVPKQAQQASVAGEIAALGGKIKALVDQAAEERLAGAVQDYRRAAAQLLHALIEIDALAAVIANDQSQHPIRQVLRLESLPAIGIDVDDLEDLAPWQLLASGEKLIFTRETALPTVQHRYLAILEDIKGTLYGQ